LSYVIVKKPIVRNYLKLSILIAIPQSNGTRSPNMLAQL